MPRVTALAACLSVALAPCAYALPALDAQGNDQRIEIQLTPAGDFKPSDGRKLPVDHWHINAAVAARVIDRFHARTNPAVIDYEHQTLLSTENGQPAPAAGWIRDLVWHEGRGLFALVELTDRARTHIAAREYLYISPVMLYDAKTGDVQAIQMAAITNTPALDGMQPLELRAAATFGIHHHDEESPMNKLHLAICAALALAAASTTEDQAIEALNAHFKLDPLAGVRKALGTPDDAKPEAVTAACVALKTKAEAVADPDPAKFVSVASFELVKTQLTALTTKMHSEEVETAVSVGLADGRLLPAQKDWATKLGMSDIAALTAYLATATPIAALKGTQTQGKKPDGETGDPNLTVDELAVCTATGIDPKDFAAAKAA